MKVGYYIVFEKPIQKIENKLKITQIFFTVELPLNAKTMLVQLKNKMISQIEKSFSSTSSESPKRTRNPLRYAGISEQNIKCRAAGPSTIPVQVVQHYCCQFHTHLNYDLIPAVKKFKKTIETDSVIRIHFNDQILQTLPLHKDPMMETEFRLLGDTVDEAMVLINTAITTPPRFENNRITGVPLLTMFMDFINSPSGSLLFSLPTINKCLKELFDTYSNDMLKTQKSLKYMKEWISGPALKYWKPHEFQLPDMNNKQTFGFACWQDFFLRQFKEGARPLDLPEEGSGIEEDDIITTACQSFPILDPMMPVTDIQKKDEFWLKDQKYSIYDIFQVNEDSQNKAYADMFIGGTIYQGFLDPFTYHRWHSPVNGVIEKIYLVEGSYYLSNYNTVDRESHKDYLNSQPFVMCTSTRLIYIIKADNPKIGHIAFIAIGMSEVSTCVSIKKQGDRVKKGELIGHFEFGGSSHAVLFRKECVLDFSRNIESAYYMNLKTKQIACKLVNVRKELARVY